MTNNNDKKVLNVPHLIDKGNVIRNVPALRFPEFSGEWSKDTLQNVVAFSNGKAHESCVDENGCYILVNSKFISTEGSVIKKATLQLSPLFKSQFVMVMSDLPNGKALAKCFYIEEDNIYTLNQRICSFTTRNRNISRFLMYQINRNKYYLRYDDGINQTNLKKGEVLACPVFIPSIQEQTKIATFIHLLDKRIATQNKIIEDLKKLKSAIIEEHYKHTQKQNACVADLGVPFNVGNLSKEELSETGTSCVIYGELFTTYGEIINHVESHTNKLDGMTLSKKGDLLFPSSTTVDALSLIAPSAINVDNVILGGDMFGIHINSGFNAQYLSYYFNHLAKKQFAKHAKGSTIIHLHYKDIEKAQLLLPCLVEQNKMAACLVLLDEKIRIESSHLQSVVKQKMYLLHQMFI